MSQDNEKTIAWIVTAVGLLVFVFAFWADSFGNRSVGFTYSGGADYIWKAVEQQRNSILTRLFGVLLIFVGGVLRIAAALESKQLERKLKAD